MNKKTTTFSTVEDLNSVVLNASAQELSKWLHTPPHRLAGQWRSMPAPLLRAATLQDRELFKKWLDWGCSLSGSFYRYSSKQTSKYSGFNPGTPIVVELVQANPQALVWIADIQPRSLVSAVQSLVNHSPRSLNGVDWNALLRHSQLNRQDLADLTFLSLMSPSSFLDHDRALKSIDGRLCPSRSAWSRFGYIQDSIRWATDDVLAKNINRISTGALMEVDFQPFVHYGYWRALGVLLDHLEVNNPDSLTVGMKKHPVRWSNLVATVNSSNYSDLKPEELCRLWDRLSDQCVDVRTIDSNKETAFHALAVIRKWPAVVKEHALRKVFEAKPILVHQKNRHGQTLEDMAKDNKLIAEIMPVLRSLDQSRHLDKVMHTQSSKVVKEKLRSPEPPVRRRRM